MPRLVERPQCAGRHVGQVGPRHAVPPDRARRVPSSSGTWSTARHDPAGPAGVPARLLQASHAGRLRDGRCHRPRQRLQPPLAAGQWRRRRQDRTDPQRDRPQRVRLDTGQHRASDPRVDRSNRSVEGRQDAAASVRPRSSGDPERAAAHLRRNAARATRATSATASSSATSSASTTAQPSRVGSSRSPTPTSAATSSSPRASRRASLTQCSRPWLPAGR